MDAEQEQRRDELQRIAKLSSLLAVDCEEWSEWPEVREAANKLAELVRNEAAAIGSIEYCEV